ncbi:uncharacterized protein TNCV_1445131 [Trichonephila clavipes]|nr:uncharacterized protein TNCV_1445131 [Trichonephila clavipes]
MVCPIGEDLWCGFKKAEASGKACKHKNSLPVAVVEAMHPIFRDLSHPDLLKNVCMKKQNQMKVFIMSFGHVFPKQHLYRLKHFHLVFMMLFVPLMMWYWARTCDKASHSPIPIPLCYHGRFIDGTWQRRGYTSMKGCIAALTVDTGIVDIEIMSYCPTCRTISETRSNESQTFAADLMHHSNFQSSALMEAVQLESSNVLLANEALNMHIMVTGTLRALSVSKILMGRIASQNMNALVMFKRE